MKKTALLILISFLCLNSFAQKNEGKYLNDIGETIEISRNKLYYIARKTIHLKWWEKDTLAICNVKRVGRNVLKVTSIPQFPQKPSVDCVYEERGDDSIKVNFVMPYNRDDLEITIDVDDYTRRYQNTNHTHSLMIPRCKRFSCSIRPTKWVAEHDTAKTYGHNSYSPFFLPDGQLTIDPGINRVDIEIPELNNYYFAKYFIKDEYILIRDGYLHWKGKIYKKINSRIPNKVL